MTTKEEYISNFNVLVGSAVPVIITKTREPYKVVEALEDFVYGYNLAIMEKRKAHKDQNYSDFAYGVWNFINGWSVKQANQFSTDPEDLEMEAPPEVDNIIDVATALAKVIGTDAESLGEMPTGIYAMCWPHPTFDNPVVKTYLLAAAHRFLSEGKRLVLIIPESAEIPSELQDYMAFLDYATPSDSERKAAIQNVLRPYISKGHISSHTVDEAGLNTISSAGAGMIGFDFENSISRAINTLSKSRQEITGESIAKLVLHNKTEMVKRSEILEVMPEGNMAEIGGLENLKEWIRKRRLAFSKEATEFGVDRPKGIFLVGPPGCLSGDTVIPYRYGKKNCVRSLKLKDLYKKFNSPLKKTADPNEPLYALSYNEDGKLKQNKVNAVVYSGVRPVYKLVTDSGRSINLTADHPILTAKGEFVQAQNLLIGTKILMRGKSEFGYSLVIIETVSSFTYLFEDHTYDLQMEAPYHNFVANEFIVHNSGKSASAKAIGNELGINVIKFDVSRVFNSLVGSSEARVRRALADIAAMTPCVALLDEVDKAFDMNSGGGDSGVGMRILGAILTFMQENNDQVFWVMTANRVNGLPPELLRKGRLDELFCLSIPNDVERLEILNIHLRKRNQNPNEIQGLDVAVKLSKGYVAAELEAAVKEAVLESFVQNIPVTGNLIAEQLQNMKPLSIAFKKEFDAMALWAENNARPASKDAATISTPTKTSKSSTIVKRDRVIDI